MIDWYRLVHSAVWVSGLAIILAVLALASYRTCVQGVRLRQVLRASALLLPFGVGMFLFCLGWLFGNQTW